MSAIALAVASLGSAQAQQAAPEQLSYVVGAGLTFGGDKLVTAKFSDGSSVNIRAGKFLQLLGGIDYRVNEQFSFQGTVGFHVDDTPQASNGSVKFQRFPMEVLAYFHPNAQWRIGGGARYAASPKLSGSGFGAGANYSFKSTAGGIVEAEYFYGDRAGLKLRYVSEKYTVDQSGEKVSGNHFGILANYYF